MNNSKLCLATLLMMASQSSVAQTMPESYRDGDFYVHFLDEETASVSMNPDKYAEGRWLVFCRVDQIYDVNNCSISGGDGAIFLFFGGEKLPISICIGGHDFPGRTGLIRVGSMEPIETDETGCVPAGTFLSELSDQTVVTTRRYTWPRDLPQDLRADLGGLSIAMTVIDKLRTSSE